MQLAFINNLMKMRSEGMEKALLLSSTGTGKTYASAFAVRELGYQKVLFLVHRNQIAEQALKSYQKVFGPSVTMGLVTGKSHDYGADFIFATVQTLSKTENLGRFARDHFECCIYDEAHHTSADSYKKVMDYFTPQFTLGMTATPDKRDDHIEGRNIYEIFDHNIAYEIRLQKAMEEDLLCPFHYFGITDLEIVDDTMVNGNKLTKEEKLQNFRFLTSDERVKYVMEQAEYYGYSGNRVKGLIFCSRIEEANELSKKFNEYGWRTLALSGADSEEVRRDAIERLVNDDINELDYILSVDIFSEGWEFPGGKIEEGETPQAALKREIMEELDTEIEVGKLIDMIEYDYPDFHLFMGCYWCSVVRGDLILKEHEAARWLTKDKLRSVEWLPADIRLIDIIQREL